MTTLILPRPRNTLLDRLRTIRLGLGASSTVGYPLSQPVGGVATAGNGLLNDLVAYWALDEAAGANDALDKHANALALTQVGSPESAVGLVYGTARTTTTGKSFYGSHNALRPGNNDFAFSTWVFRTGSSAFCGILGTWDIGTAEFVCMHSINNKPRFLMSANGNENTPTTLSSSSTLGLNSWSLIICQYDASADLMSIQVNNEAIGTKNHANGAYVGTAAQRFGQFSGPSGSEFFGRIGPFAFWKNRLLNTAARTALWNGHAGLAYSAFTT